MANQQPSRYQESLGLLDRPKSCIPDLRCLHQPTPASQVGDEAACRAILVGDFDVPGYCTDGVARLSMISVFLFSKHEIRSDILRRSHVPCAGSFPLRKILDLGHNACKYESSHNPHLSLLLQQAGARGPLHSLWASHGPGDLRHIHTEFHSLVACQHRQQDHGSADITSLPMDGWGSACSKIVATDAQNAQSLTQSLTDF